MFSRKIAFTIDHTQVGGSDLTNFTVIVVGTFAELKTVGNGGQIQNVDSSFPSPFPPADFVVSPNPDGSAKYDFVHADYDATTGYCEVHFRCPFISASVDTTFYFVYNNASVTGYQGNQFFVWDANYKAVYSLTNGFANDSTITHAEGAVVGATQVTGVVGEALHFVQAHGTDIVTISAAAGGGSDFPNYSRPMTFEFWAQFPSGTSHGTTYTVMSAVSNINNFLIYKHATNDTLDFFTSGGERSIPYPTDGNPHHFVLTIDSSGELTATMDGVQQTVTTVTAGALNPQTTTAIQLGQWPGVSAWAFDGMLDELRFSNSARISAGAVGYAVACYNNQKTGSTFLSAASPSAAVNLIKVIYEDTFDQKGWFSPRLSIRGWFDKRWTELGFLVSNTLAVGDESLSTIAQSLALADELLKGLTQSGTPADENLLGISQSGTPADENLLGIAGSPVLADESQQVIAPTLAIGDESLLTLTQSGSPADEYLLGIAQSNIPADENLQGIAGSPVVPDESQQVLAQTGVLADESLQTITQSPTPADENLLGIAQTSVRSDENLGFVTQSGVLPDESTQVITSNPAPADESLQTLATSGVDPDESLQTIATSPVVADENLLGIAQSKTPADENLLGISGSPVLGDESLLGIAQAPLVPYESLGTVAQTGQPADENLKGIAGSGSLADESTGLLAVFQSSDLAIESLGAVASTPAVPLESSAVILSTSPVADESLLLLSQSKSSSDESLLGVQNPGTASDEALGAVAGSPVVSDESSAVVQSLSQVADENLKAIEASSTASTESLSLVARAIDFIQEWSSFVWNSLVIAWESIKPSDKRVAKIGPFRQLGQRANLTWVAPKAELTKINLVTYTKLEPDATLSQIPQKAELTDITPDVVLRAKTLEDQ